jgi:ComF family protein
VLNRALHAVRDGLLGLSHPEECRVCGGAVESWDDGPTCEACWKDPQVTLLTGKNICVKCGLQMHASVNQSGASRTCGSCAAFPFTAARSCGIYSGALEANIVFLKATPHICARLRSLIERTFRDHREALASDVVVPVPLHRLREKQRGFNQAAVIANVISKRFHLELDHRSLLRIKATEKHRAGLDAFDRAKSVEGAFAVSSSAFAGTRALLVDDVYTTGSTVSAAALTLLDAGARRVSILTIARAQ